MNRKGRQNADLSDATEGDTKQSQRSTTLRWATDHLPQEAQRTLEMLRVLLYVLTTVSIQIIIF
jgi:hypothetical protein